MLISDNSATKSVDSNDHVCKKDFASKDPFLTSKYLMTILEPLSGCNVIQSHKTTHLNSFFLELIDGNFLDRVTVI